jgi:hypothetical protein
MNRYRNLDGNTNPSEKTDNQNGTKSEIYTPIYKGIIIHIYKLFSNCCWGIRSWQVKHIKSVCERIVLK